MNAAEQLVPDPSPLKVENAQLKTISHQVELKFQ
jgi:hypothetical protein